MENQINILDKAENILINYLASDMVSILMYLERINISTNEFDKYVYLIKKHKSSLYKEFEFKQYLRDNLIDKLNEKEDIIQNVNSKLNKLFKRKVKLLEYYQKLNLNPKLIVQEIDRFELNPEIKENFKNFYTEYKDKNNSIAFDEINNPNQEEIINEFKRKKIPLNHNLIKTVDSNYKNRVERLNNCYTSDNVINKAIRILTKTS